MGTLHEEQYTLLIISCSVLLIKEMFQTKVVGKIKTRIMFGNFFSKIVPLWDNVEKYRTNGQATDDSVAHANCMLDT